MCELKCTQHNALQIFQAHCHRYDSSLVEVPDTNKTDALKSLLESQYTNRHTTVGKLPCMLKSIICTDPPKKKMKKKPILFLLFLCLEITHALKQHMLLEVSSSNSKDL